MKACREDMLRVRVKSLADGNLLIEPFYDRKVWNGTPGVISRLTFAAELEAAINQLLEDEGGGAR